MSRGVNTASPTTRHADVCQPAIHELFAGALGLDVDQNAIGRLPLAAMARYGIPVVEMPAFTRLE